MNDDTSIPETPAAVTATTAPEYAPVAQPTMLAAPAAAAPRHHRWPMWVASAAIAVVVFGVGFRVGLGFGARFGTGRGLRAGYAAAAVQGFRSGARGQARGPQGGGFRR